jgi:alpha-ketoglutarate-dependent taurine dioxygenase
MTDHHANQANASPVLALKRRPVEVTSGSLVTSRLVPGQSLPLLFEPASEQVNLAGWAAKNHAAIETAVLTHGAVLFRGFAVRGAGPFEEIVRAISGEPLQYSERSSPRSHVSGRVYTSTDYAPNEPIFPHNEHSYAVTFPLRLYFFCETPPATGGATPLADVRRVFGRLSPRLRDQFERRKWLYVRNIGDGFGLPLETVFQTRSADEINDYCRRNAIEIEWKSPQRVRTRQRREAMIRHPRTGELVWFNHATFFHVTTLDPIIRDQLLAQFGEEDLPNNTRYGDGGAIEPEVLDELRRAYLDELVRFTWQRGDVLLIDNVLTAHARDPYTGPRKILVSMAEPIVRAELANP